MKHDVAAESAEFRAIYEQLQGRYDPARLALEECHPEHGLILALRVPNGREDREVRFTHADQARPLLTVPFEKYVLVGPYEAIASYDAGTIEIGLKTHGFLFFTLKPIGGTPVEPSKRHDTVEIQSDTSDVRIVIRPPSEAWKLLCWPASNVTNYTLTVSGVSIERHDQALGIINGLILSLVFQMDLLTTNRVDVLLYRDILDRPRSDTRAGKLSFPEVEYDFTPLVLYRYGRAATELPLVEFLAYYQVLEFYFSTYSQKDAQQRVQQVLKNPTFRVDRPSDINRILAAIKSSAFESAASERAQLKATVDACVTSEELRGFLCEFDERKQFFIRNANRELSTVRVLADQPLDLRESVANRIYDIRCKIVHTKNASSAGEGENGFLQPFSAEAALLNHDIDLLRFIAQKVLIASSSPLHMS